MSFPEQAAYPDASQATTSLVLGILGIVCCGPLGIVAWVIGNNEMKGIEEGRRNPANLGTAKAGRILGIVGTALLAIGIIWVILAFTGALVLPFIDV
jgi:hypothetical protein